MILIYAFIFAGFLLALYLLFLFVCALPVNTSKEYENNSRFYRGLLYSATSAVLKLLRIKVKVAGREKLPAGQKVLFVGNHRSNFDTIIQWQSLKSWDLAFISKEENFRIPFFGRFIRRCCFLSVDREDPRKSLAVFDKAAGLLKRQEVSIGVYPEGTRSVKGELLPFHNGVFRIAGKADVPIAVMAVSGTERIRENIPFRGTEVHLDIVDIISPDEVKTMRTVDVGKRVRKVLEDRLYGGEEIL